MRVRQRDSSDCGAACIVSICAFYGRRLSVARARHYASTGIQGTTVLGILEAMAALGMTAKAIKALPCMLSTLPLPAIAHIRTADQAGHYVVLARAKAQGVNIMDPATGRFRRMPSDIFAQSWTGVLILATPAREHQSTVIKSTVRRLTELAFPDRYLLFISVLAAGLLSILGLSTSFYLQQLVDIALAGNGTRLLDLFSLLMIGLVFVQLGCGVSRDFLALKCGRRINSRLILEYYDHLLHLPQSFFDRMQVGEIISRINDAVRISIFINEVAIGFILNGLTVIFTIIVMLVRHWELALLVLVVFPVYLLLFFINDRLSRIWQRRLMAAGAAFDAQLAETLAAAGTVKKMALEADVQSKTAGKLAAVLNTAHRFSSRQIGIQHGAGFTTRLLTVLLLWAGCYFVVGGSLTRGELFAFFALTGYLTSPVLELLGAGKLVRDTQIAAERLFEIMELDREQNGSTQIAGTISLNIIFREVTFGYGGAKPVLQNVNLCIPEGSFIGITGQSGAGKSTFAALMQKIYLPTSGSITLNGTDIRELDNRSLRNRIAVVPQHTDLFSGSLAENIAIGTAGTGIDINRIRDICGRLGILDFIDRLPEGLETIPNSPTYSLSGGERQRLAIARALYRRPAVLILDEATSALDAEAEKEVMQTLEWYNKKGGTVIAIAHRASVLSNCRHVYTLENSFLK